jgi:hypothetical protein
MLEDLEENVRISGRHVTGSRGLSLDVTELFNSLEHGRATAQAVSRWLPTAAARVRALVSSSGIYGGQSGSGAGFLRVLRFPLPIFIPPTSSS